MGAVLHHPLCRQQQPKVLQRGPAADKQPRRSRKGREGAVHVVAHKHNCQSTGEGPVHDCASAEGLRHAVIAGL